MLLVLGSSALAMEMPSLIRIRENNLEVAHLVFVTEHAQIDLVGMVHVGEVEFFAAVNHLAVDHIVLYELYGCDLEQQRRRESVLASLPEAYQRLYHNLRCLLVPYELIAKAFNLSSQCESFAPKNPSMLIHADLSVSKKIHAIYENRDALMAYLDTVARHILDSNEKKTDVNVGIDAIVCKKIASAPSLKVIIQHQINTLYQGSEAPNENYQARVSLLLRHLEKLLQCDLPKKVFIPYGVDHQSDVIEFLQRHGATLQQKKWLKVLSLDDETLPTK